MAIEGYTGQGTTVAFSGIGAIACVRSISLPEFSLETVDASCLDSASPVQPPNAVVAEFTKKVPGMLVDAGEVQITAVFGDTDVAQIPNGVEDTLTITLPTSAGVAGKVLSGTGFITSAQMPSIEMNGLLEQTITFVFNGNTGPTFA